MMHDFGKPCFFVYKFALNVLSYTFGSSSLFCTRLSISD